jgi:hypothetical protein
MIADIRIFVDIIGQIIFAVPIFLNHLLNPIELLFSLNDLKCPDQLNLL